MKPWYLYILSGTTTTALYTGISNDPERRLANHNKGKGAKFTRRGGPWRIVYLELVGTMSEALRRERQVKSLRRSQKLALTQSYAERGAISHVPPSGKPEALSEPCPRGPVELPR